MCKTSGVPKVMSIKALEHWTRDGDRNAKFLNVIEITQAKWEEMCQVCDVPQPMVLQILEHWSKDGDSSPKFLDKIEKDFYSLGSAYSRALAFLIEQGRRRVQRSEAGKKSHQQKTQKQGAKRRSK